ncbi:MAG: 50S ribosomal protein L22 [Amoebophilaceae bacterium]|nr:50S ribosomal protein L22 [Amoebophilaceae bacterium]
MEAIARLRKLPISARKVSLLATLIRGKRAAISLVVLQNRQQPCAVQLRKLLLSAISNWEAINATLLEDADVVITKITVDGAGMLKRIRPASKGIAHRIRKRSSHVTIAVDSIVHTAATALQKKSPLHVVDTVDQRTLDK